MNERDARGRRLTTLVAAICILLSVTPRPALALCGGRSPADVIFEGVAQPGPAAEGKLLSPATFVVERYMKGDGPRRVHVTTGISDGGDGLTALISTGVYPRVGERWEIRATRHAEDGVLTTSTCHGSQLLDAEAELLTAAAPEGSSSRSTWAALIAVTAGAAAVAVRALLRRRRRTRSG